MYRRPFPEISMVILLIIATFMLFVYSSMKEPLKQAQIKLRMEKALELANKEAITLGYDIKSMNVELDENNTAWNTFISKYPSYLENNPEIKNKLKDRNYWAVYYKPTVKPGEILFGGGLLVFVDSSNGEIITVIRGK